MQVRGSIVEEIIIAPVIIFMIVVAPIWLILHYRSKRQISQGFSEEEYIQLSELSELADKMANDISNWNLDFDPPYF